MLCTVFVYQIFTWALTVCKLINCPKALKKNSSKACLLHTCGVQVWIYKEVIFPMHQRALFLESFGAGDVNGCSICRQLSAVLWNLPGPCIVVPYWVCYGFLVRIVGKVSNPEMN